MFSTMLRVTVIVFAITAPCALAYTQQQANAFEAHLTQLEGSNTVEGLKRYVSYFYKYLEVSRFSELSKQKQAKRANHIVYRLLHGKPVSDISLLKLLSAYDAHGMGVSSVAVVDELVKRKDLIGLARRGWNLVHSQDGNQVKEGLGMLTNVSSLTSGGLGADSLGRAYLYGIGVPQNDALAQHWFSQAAPTDTEAKLWMAEFGKSLGKDSEVRELRRKWLLMAVESLDVIALKTMAHFAKTEDRDSLAAADWEFLAWTQNNNGEYRNLVSMVEKVGSGRALTSLRVNPTEAGLGYHSWITAAHPVEWLGLGFISLGWYLLLVQPIMLAIAKSIRSRR